MDATTRHLADLAAARTAAFENLRAKSRSGTVHDVEPVTVLGVNWPGAACHSGVYGGELSGLEPTAEPVTCKLCLAATDNDAPRLVDEHPTLF